MSAFLVIVHLERWTVRSTSHDAASTTEWEGEPVGYRPTPLSWVSPANLQTTPSFKVGRLRSWSRHRSAILRRPSVSSGGRDGSSSILFTLDRSIAAWSPSSQTHFIGNHGSCGRDASDGQALSRLS